MKKELKRFDDLLGVNVNGFDCFDFIIGNEVFGSYTRCKNQMDYEVIDEITIAVYDIARIENISPRSIYISIY